MKSIQIGQQAQAFHRLPTLQSKVDKVLEQEEIYWHQRSRIEWIQHGDINTPYFHQRANVWPSLNRIRGFLDAREIWQSSPTGIVNTLTVYF